MTTGVTSGTPINKIIQLSSLHVDAAQSPSHVDAAQSPSHVDAAQSNWIDGLSCQLYQIWRNDTKCHSMYIAILGFDLIIQPSWGQQVQDTYGVDLIIQPSWGQQVHDTSQRLSDCGSVCGIVTMEVS